MTLAGGVTTCFGGRVTNKNIVSRQIHVDFGDRFVQVRCSLWNDAKHRVDGGARK